MNYELLTAAEQGNTASVLMLLDKGVDIIHCGEVGLSDAKDSVHLQFAVDNERIMVSCDDDFERLHTQWSQEDKEHAGIVYFRMVDQCQSISIVVREIMFLHEAADYETDLYNQVWRAQG